MVKHFEQKLRHEEFCQKDKLVAKSELLSTLIKKDHIKDRRKHCLKHNIAYNK